MHQRNYLHQVCNFSNIFRHMRKSRHNSGRPPVYLVPASGHGSWPDPNVTKSRHGIRLQPELPNHNIFTKHQPHQPLPVALCLHTCRQSPNRNCSSTSLNSANERFSLVLWSVPVCVSNDTQPLSLTSLTVLSPLLSHTNVDTFPSLTRMLCWCWSPS